MEHYTFAASRLFLHGTYLKSFRGNGDLFGGFAFGSRRLSVEEWNGIMALGVAPNLARSQEQHPFVAAEDPRHTPGHQRRQRSSQQGSQAETGKVVAT